MPDRGKLVVASILVVAVALAVFAWYWRWQQGHRAAEFWGAEASQLIRGARQTELLVLQPATEHALDKAVSAESPEVAVTSVSIDGETYHVVSTADLAHSPGLIHARHSLTEDASFIWAGSTDGCNPVWSHAMRLTQDNRSAVLALDFECQRICLVEAGKTIQVVPRIADGFQRIFQRAQAAQKTTGQ